MLGEGLLTAYSNGPTARCHHHVARDIEPSNQDQPGVRANSTVAVFVSLRRLYEDGAYSILARTVSISRL
eukprot:3708574-Alexandrium_andersonii.AAC.1